MVSGANWDEFPWGACRSKHFQADHFFLCPLGTKFLEDLLSSPGTMASQSQIPYPVLSVVCIYMPSPPPFCFLPARRQEQKAGRGTGQHCRDGIDSDGVDCAEFEEAQFYLQIHSVVTAVISLVTVRSRCSDHLYSTFPSEHLTLPCLCSHSRCP